MPRITITDYPSLLRAGRLNLLNGLTKGKPLGDIIYTIMNTAAQYGADEYDRHGTVSATVEETKFDDLVTAQVGVAIDDLFGGRKLDSIVRDATTAGVAFGYQSRKKTNEDRKAESLLEKILASKDKGKVDTGLLNDFFVRLDELIPELAIRYVRRLMIENGINFSAKDVPAYKGFVEKYRSLVMMDA